MNVLDENILESQRELLKSWRLRVKQIGFDLGRKGMIDERVITFLQELASPTFFTRDQGFYKLTNCKTNCCIVCMAVKKEETAVFIRRFVRHPYMNTKGKRMGKVVWVSHTGLSYWQIHKTEEQSLLWVDV